MYTGSSTCKMGLEAALQNPGAALLVGKLLVRQDTGPDAVISSEAAVCESHCSILSQMWQWQQQLTLRRDMK